MKSSLSIGSPYWKVLHGMFDFLRWSFLRDVEYFFFSFRIIVNDQFNRIEYNHSLSEALLESSLMQNSSKLRSVTLFPFGNTDLITPKVDALGITPAAHPADGRHAWIIPAVNMFIIYQLQQLTLAHHCITEVSLANSYWCDGNISRFNKPVVQFTVWYKFKCAGHGGWYSQWNHLPCAKSRDR